MTQHIALVTGGGRGLGKNATLKLASKEIGIILTWNSNEKEAQQIVGKVYQSGGKTATLPLDVGDISTFSRLVQQVQGTLQTQWQSDSFDCLLNNAGIGISAPYPAFTEAQFDQFLNIHFKGPFFLAQSLLPLVNKGGRILNVSAGLARFALPGYSAYAAMEGAMEVLTRYQTKELGERGITVNIIAPGAIEADFSGGNVRDNAQLDACITSQAALRCIDLPDDIGDAVTTLLSDELTWMTTQRIEVPGGMFL